MRGMAKGMVSTLRHALRPAFTIGYPWEPTVLPERSRTWFELTLDEDGVPLCKACNLCAKNCADQAIVLDSVKRDGPGRRLTSFSIDLGLCMYCGICVENCPSSALRHTGDFERATHERESTVLILFQDADAEIGPAQQTAPTASATDEPAQAEGGVAS